MKKNVFLSAIAIFFAIIMVFICEKAFNTNSKNKISFTKDDVTIEIREYSSNGKKYFFLPNFLSSEIEVDTGADINTLSKIPTMFVYTSTGSLKEIINSKNHKESAGIVLFDPSGEIAFRSNKATISGHGNSTWGKEKKPFEINFNDAYSLLNMQKADEWVLIANAMDISNIRNRIAYDMAKELMMPYCVDAEFIDLYVNGEYYGLYMLSQSVKSLMKWNDSNDYCLYSSELSGRKDKLKWSVSFDKCVVGLKDSSFDYCEADEKQYLISANNSFNSQNESMNYFDFDSWSSKYLIDEVLENYDSGVTSNYFYYSINDGNSRSTIMAGPVWDYDNAICSSANQFGTTYNPRIIYAGNRYRNSATGVLWYSKMLENDEFKSEALYKYQEIIKPYIEELVKNEFSIIRNVIDKSEACNTIRWDIKYDISDEIKKMSNWLNARIAFLDDYWIHKKDFHSVTIEKQGTVSDYYRFYLPIGSSLSSDENYLFAEAFTKEIVFRDKETNKPIEADTIIDKDCFLEMPQYSSLKDSIYNKIYYNRGAIIGLVSIFILVIMILHIAIKDFRENAN